MLRLALVLAACCALARPSVAAAPAGAPDRVEVAAAKTSIYVGSVTLTMPAFVRKDGVYESTYAAKVLPYFFANESGRLAIEMSDAQLARLIRGETVDFTGRGIRADGVERRVEGRATPADGASGKLKVRVFVSRRTELIFNTTYRFPQAAQ